MLVRAIGLTLLGCFGIGVRPGVLGHDNVVHLTDDERYKYCHIKGFNYLLFSGVEYCRGPCDSNIPCHFKYKLSFRPLKVYHNNSLVYQDCFTSNRQYD